MIKIKWNKELTEKLIDLRHDFKTQERFTSAKNNPRLLMKYWEEVAEHFGGSSFAQQVKSKYNNLLASYRVALTESKRSGAGKITWLYFKRFNDSLFNKVEIVPANYLECGVANEETLTESGISRNGSCVDDSEHLLLNKKKKNGSVKTKLLELILKKMESEIHNDGGKYVEKKFFKKKMKNVDQKLDKILKFLNEKE